MRVRSKSTVPGTVPPGPATHLATPADKLAAARQKLSIQRKNGTSERLSPIEKAARHPKSLRMAVTAKCWDCCGGGHDPNTRGTIAHCTVTDCPLYTHRPYQRMVREAS